MASFTERAECRQTGGVTALGRQNSRPTPCAVRLVVPAAGSFSDAKGFWRPAHGVCLLLFLAMMLCLPGCGGCRKTQETEEQEKQQAEEKAKKKEKEKEPFEARQPVAMPSGGNLGGACKPGHWISQVWPDVKANRGDFQGELQSEIVGPGNRKVPLVAVPYEMTTERPAALAKEQPKSLESFTWIPPLPVKASSVNFRLTAGGGGPAAIERFMVLDHMPSYRYYFVVLSQRAGRYEYLDKKLPSIHVHRPNDDVGPMKYYEVVSIPASRRPSLPNNALYWTSIAYLLWDDFDPALWDVDQQQALIDWLHWGGQIIVSGPDALEQLRNSFLRPYLPATVVKSRTFSGQDLAELNYWDWKGEVGAAPEPVKPWPGAELKKDPHAEYLPYTGDLLVERQVGRGRIVASAFRLTGPELTGWEGFDCFFNACLLRRPAREFCKDEESRFNWVHWVNAKANSLRKDAAQMTGVRYFVRDTGVDSKSYAADIYAARSAAADVNYGQSRPPGIIVANGNPVNSDESLRPEDEDGPIPLDKNIAPGLGAWNDFSPVAQAARAALKNAAGISVPKRSFIVWVVVGYLCVLVPANWIVFRLLGRVEWAWIAAPLIAIACTVVVIQLAQLNIGFARSRNEIAVIEMQPGYSRVHVARYMVLYTSLATPYEFRLDDPGGQILPFPAVSSPEQFQMRTWQSYAELVCRRGDDTQLTGFSVASNAKDYVHCEEMADFGGTVTLHRDSDGGLRVTNATTHPLDDCRAVRGQSGGRGMVTIGRLDPGATAALKFESYTPPGKVAADHHPQGSDPTGELSVDGIVEVALDHQELRPDEICLVARVTDEAPGDLTVTPESRRQQTRQAVLLVAHLAAGRLPNPTVDTKEEMPVYHQGRRVIGLRPFPATPGPSGPQTIDPSRQPEDPNDE